MSDADGAPAGNTAGKRPTRPKRDARSVEAQLKEALRLWAKNGRLTKAERTAALDAARGSWKDRPEWKGMTSIQIAAELRRRTIRRGHDA